MTAGISLVQGKKPALTERRYSSSSLPISAIGLRGRYNERGDFLISTTPAIAENTPTTTGELVFPHIATGGGYTTEFLLLNRGTASAGTISIFSESGDRLP